MDNRTPRHTERLARAEATAIKAARRAELALEMAFGVSVEDVNARDVHEVKMWIADVVLKQFAGKPQAIFEEALKMCSKQLAEHGPQVESRPR